MTTQKHIRALVRGGVALDGNKLTQDEVYELCRHRVKVDTSAGVYGVNGALVMDTQNGALYGFVGRNTNLFIIC